MLICSPAFADWTQVFNTNYKKKGIDTAVITALSEGIAPYQIVQLGVQIEELPAHELIKALFCSLVQPTIIYEAAEANQVNEQSVTEGYQLALEQCGAQMEKQLNVAPVKPFSEVPPGKKRRPAQSSPWNFD